MRIHFLLVCEGPSDQGLVPHLEDIVISAGAEEVTGVAPDLRRLPNPVGATLADRIFAAITLEPTADLLFVHRDSDDPNSSPRFAEITNAMDAIGGGHLYVGVVPVQATEAWLLLDETAIRRVARNPSGRQNLGLPRTRNVERVADPKGKLKEVLLTASGLTGRRRQKFSREFPKHRALLLGWLRRNGPIQYVPSWRRLEEDVEAAVMSLRP